MLVICNHVGYLSSCSKWFNYDLYEYLTWNNINNMHENLASNNNMSQFINGQVQDLNLEARNLI